MKAVMWLDGVNLWYVVELMVTDGGHTKVKFWWNENCKWQNFGHQATEYTSAAPAMEAIKKAHDTGVANATVDDRKWYSSNCGRYWIVRDRDVFRIMNPARNLYWSGHHWWAVKEMGKSFKHADDAESEIRMSMPPPKLPVSFCQHTTGFGLEAEGRRWEASL